MQYVLSDYTHILMGFSFWMVLAGTLWLWTRRTNKLVRIALWVLGVSLVLQLLRPGGLISVLASGVLLVGIFTILYAFDLAGARSNLRGILGDLRRGKFTREGRNEFGLYPVVEPDPAVQNDRTPGSPDIQPIIGPDGSELIPVDENLRPLADRDLPETSQFAPLPENIPDSMQAPGPFDQDTRRFPGF